MNRWGGTLLLSGTVCIIVPPVIVSLSLLIKVHEMRSLTECVCFILEYW